MGKRKIQPIQRTQLEIELWKASMIDIDESCPKCGGVVILEVDEHTQDDEGKWYIEGSFCECQECGEVWKIQPDVLLTSAEVQRENEAFSLLT